MRDNEAVPKQQERPEEKSNRVVSIQYITNCQRAHLLWSSVNTLRFGKRQH